MQAQATIEHSEAFATLAPDPAGELFLRWNLRAARRPFTAHHDMLKGKAPAPAWEDEQNVILDNPLQVMILATVVAASLGLLARRTQPGAHRGLSSLPPRTTRT